MKKNLMIVILILIVEMAILPINKIKLKAEAFTQEDIYSVYDSEKNLILETQSVSIGDVFINKMFDKYEVIFVDEEEHFAICDYMGRLKKPKITKKSLQSISSNLTYEKNIALYCTHNDESYEIGDGTSSVYGKGGIHDIANNLSKSFQNLGVNTIFDETLHIPHDSYAYSRSKVTAKNLLADYNLDAIFDIHRDGASRKLYVGNNGEEYCSVRIVVGQANPNKEANLEFAKYLMSVSEVLCPWLFIDIYFATGHYNQALSNKALLFEMGSHLVEKDLVEKTVPYLAEVVYTALYNTKVDEEGNLIIGTQIDEEETMNSYFENTVSSPDNEKESSNLSIKPNENLQNNNDEEMTIDNSLPIAIIFFSILIMIIIAIVKLYKTD